jgi:RimJ/RimL family protein N-acetyltransferase
VSETPRLRGTPPAAGDLAFLTELLGDPRVGATLGGVLAPAAVAEILASHREHWRRHGFGYRIWRDRATGEPVARGGLACATVEGEDVVEVGWAVRADRWGEGIATELGAASLEEAAGLGIGRVVAFTMIDNAASRRVMEKLGMAYDRTFVHGRWGPHALYAASLTDGDAAAGDRR